MNNIYRSPGQSFESANPIAQRQRTYRVGRFNAQRGLAANIEVLRAVAQRQMPMLRLVEQVTEAPEAAGPVVTAAPVMPLEAAPPLSVLTAEQITHAFDQEVRLHTIRSQVEDIHNERRAA